MTIQNTRREILKGSLALAGLGVLGLPEWALPALAQGETLVPFTDLPENVQREPAADRRTHRHPHASTVRSRRRISSSRPSTTAIRRSTRRPSSLKVSGLVDQAAVAVARRAAEDGRARSSIAGFECSGNRRPLQGLCGNGRWTGVPLQQRARCTRASRRRRASSCSSAPITARRKSSSARRSSRSSSSSAAACRARRRCRAEPFLAYAMNGEPLTQAPGLAAAAARAGLVRRRRT